MNRRITALWVGAIALVCGYATVRVLTAETRSWRNDLIQGALVGIGLAIVTMEILSRLAATKVNGWITVKGCANPRNGLLKRAVCTWIFPGPINVAEEATYWITQVDGDGRPLTGQRSYLLHFPPGGLPPNRAFWSLTMGDRSNRFVPNPLHRYSVSDRSGLIPNPDGSVDVYLQHAAPVGHETNWLPAPPGAFGLWLRVYLPDEAILDGRYVVPAVREAGARR